MSSIKDFASSFRFSEPKPFLHSIDLEAERAVVFKTNRKLLSEASFVDGRSDIALGAPESVKLTDLVSEPAPEMRDRYIFNVAFCGSTLLSRLIDVPGRSLVLKEPKCLTDLAAWKTVNVRKGRPLDLLAPALRLARNALRRPFAAGEAVTVKAACWVNGLLDDFADRSDKLLPVFVVIDRPGFLRAVLRGGPERMTHTSQLAWHMASGDADREAMLKGAVESASDDTGRAANLAMVAHHLQLESFKRAMQRGGWDDDRVVDFELISQQPSQAAMKACRALDIGLHFEEREMSVEENGGKHSKQPQISFSAEKLKRVDRSILALHAKPFDSALNWAENALGTEIRLGSDGLRAA